MEEKEVEEERAGGMAEREKEEEEVREGEGNSGAFGERGRGGERGREEEGMFFFLGKGGESCWGEEEAEDPKGISSAYS